jgi:hypothetical protein
MEPEPTRHRPAVAPIVDVPLGRLLITPAAKAILHQDDLLIALNRHSQGDWGTVGPEDRAENDLSLKAGFRILSAYETKAGETFWIITEADRTATTVLLPSDY